jgi:hypothetical protein
MSALFESQFTSYAEHKANETADAQATLQALYALTATVIKHQGAQLTETLRICRRRLESVGEGGFKEVLSETIVLLATLSRTTEAKNLATVFSNDLGKMRLEAGVEIVLRASKPADAEIILSLGKWHLYDEVMELAASRAAEKGNAALARVIANLIQDKETRRLAVGHALNDARRYQMACGY